MTVRKFQKLCVGNEETVDARACLQNRKVEPTAARSSVTCARPQKKMTPIGTRTIIAAFQEMLPRELRDICYGFMTGSKDFDVLGRRGGPLDSYHGRVQLPPEEAWLMAQLPRPLAKEYLQIFYERNRFHLKHTDDIPPFLARDMFGSGIIPRDHVRHMTIDLPLKTLVMAGPSFKAHIRKTTVNQQLANMRALKAIRYKKDFHLVFQIPSDLDFGITRSTLDAVEPALRELENMGSEVVFEVSASKRKRQRFHSYQGTEHSARIMKGLRELQLWRDTFEESF